MHFYLCCMYFFFGNIFNVILQRPMWSCRPSMRYRSCSVRPMGKLLVIWWLLLLLLFAKPQISRMLQGSSYFLFLSIYFSLLCCCLFTCSQSQIIGRDEVSETPSCRCRWQAGNPLKYSVKKVLWLMQYSLAVPDIDHLRWCLGGDHHKRECRGSCP